MTSHYERWCIEWGRVGMMHMSLRLIGYDGPTYRAAQMRFRRDMLIFGEAAVVIPGPLPKT